MTMKDKEELEDLWSDLSPEGRRLVTEVIRIEREKLHMTNPRNVNKEILKEIRRIVD